jgi:hypothetical protein
MLNAMRRLFITFGALISMTLHAQISSIESGAGLGKILDIYPNMPQQKLHSLGYLTLRFENSDKYQGLYGMPKHGVRLSIHDLGNSQHLGWGVGMQYQAAFEQKIGNRWRTIQGFEIGGIYVTKPYHPITNTQNIVFGSYFSALISASAGLKYQMQSTYISLQASFWHSSNAHTVLPNVGMNTPIASLAFGYQFRTNYRTQQDTSSLKFKLPNKWSAMVIGAWGTNEAGGTVRPTNGDTYQKYLGAIGLAYRMNTIHRLTFSIEGYYDQTYALWNDVMGWKNNNPQLQASAVMLMAGHEFIYGRFGLIVQAGLNVYNPTLNRLIGEVERPTTMNRIKRYVPGRFAARYYLNQHETSFASCFIQAAVKSNLGQADFFEAGLGMLISGRQLKKK